jgi:hypothetical protein
MQCSSVIDNVLCRIDFKQFISHFEITDPNRLTDHCYVHFTLKSCKRHENEDKTENDYSDIPYSYKWVNRIRKCTHSCCLSSNSAMNVYWTKKETFAKYVPVVQGYHLDVHTYTCSSL